LDDGEWKDLVHASSPPVGQTSPVVSLRPI
jgi:hypothetical protein